MYTQHSEDKYLDGLEGGKINSWNWVGTKYGIYKKHLPAPLLEIDQNTLKELGYKWHLEDTAGVLLALGDRL